MNDLYEVGGSLDVVVPHPDHACNYLEIETFCYSDGKWAYGLNVFTNIEGMGFRFDEYHLCETKQEAIQKAASYVLRWAASKGNQSKSETAIVEKIKKACLRAIEEAKFG